MNGVPWQSIFQIAIILLVGLGGLLILHASLKSFEKRLKGSNMPEERTRRLLTLAHVWRSIGSGLILLIVLLMALNEAGIDILPLLASAGVVGLALSLGAQTLIKDFLGGIIILLENQFTIGDVVTIGALTGTVERITLRATYLRDAEGKLNLVPNGDIRTVTNLTTQWAQVVITLSFDYETDMQQVLQALEEAIRAVQADPDTASSILEDPKAFGWTGFTDWAVQAQIIAKTLPGKQWPVARALRRAAMEALQQAGIRPAQPRQLPAA